MMMMPVAKALLPDIHQHFNSLLQNKVGADVAFQVGGETFAAHRCVLAARSTVFMAQLFGPMKETSSVIHIKDMDAKVFGALLSFIYTDSFPEMLYDNDMETDKMPGVVKQEQEDEATDDKMSEGVEQGQEEEAVEDEMRLQWLQDLLVAADRYDVQRLKFICEKQLSEHINVSSVMPTLALAEQHHCCGLKEACFKFIQVQFPSCLQTVMATDGWDYVVSTYVEQEVPK
jgi:speckle-type POZ protein